MIITPETAITALSVVANLIIKISSVMRTGEPQSIEEELARLNSARLRPSEDIIADADRDSAGEQ